MRFESDVFSPAGGLHGHVTCKKHQTPTSQNVPAETIAIEHSPRPNVAAPRRFMRLLNVRRRHGLRSMTGNLRTSKKQGGGVDRVST